MMIFVFGSNLAGVHGAGAARYAFKHRGAQWGIGVGMTGGCYAIPTKGWDIENLPFEEVADAITTFIHYAEDHPELRFELTPIGCGLAGHNKADVWKHLRSQRLPSNVYLSSTWVTD